MLKDTFIVYRDGDRSEPLCEWLTEDGKIVDTLKACEIRRFCKIAHIAKVVFAKGGKPTKTYKVIANL